MDINGHRIVACLPRFSPGNDEPTSYVVMLRNNTPPLAQISEWIVTWVPNLNVDHWGQGHYYRDANEALGYAYQMAGVTK